MAKCDWGGSRKRVRRIPGACSSSAQCRGLIGWVDHASRKVCGRSGYSPKNPDRFTALKEGLEKHDLDEIIQFSTGGRSGSGRDRGGMLPLSPDMASLSVGSNNFPTRVYENSPDLVDWLASEMLAHDIKPEIEAFDLGHIVQATRMAADGRLKGPLYVQFVMGVKNAMPADEPILDFYIETLQRLTPDAQWCAAGIGPAQYILDE